MIFFFAKLGKYGFRGRILCLLKNYFTNRFQFVQTHNKISSSRSMSCGLPQGSVLGSFLVFNIFNDLPKIAEGSEVVLLADDTTICNAEKNCCDSFDSSLNKVDRWFKTNGLCVNPGKTQIMKFGNNFSKDYFAFGTTVQITNVCKYLTKFCGIVWKARYVFAKQQMLCLYKAYVNPTITYRILI